MSCFEKCFVSILLMRNILLIHAHYTRNVDVLLVDSLVFSSLWMENVKNAHLVRSFDFGELFIPTTERGTIMKLLTWYCIETATC